MNQWKVVMMRAWIHAARAIVVCGLALVGCSPDPNVTAGCASGNRSQCVVEASMGAHFGCALLTDHSVWCWGRNDESQLGYPTTDLCNEDIGGGQTRSVACHTFPFQVHGLDHVTHVFSGEAFSCALRDDGTVQCWGANEAGQLGNGGVLPSAQPVPVAGLTMVTSLTLGARHACAIANGAVRCWGANDKGQLGATSTSQCMLPGGMGACSLAPIAATGVSGAVDLAGGALHTCARIGGGQVQCWGDNSDGQLGNGMPGSTPMTRMPVRTASQPLASVVAITAGSFHTCALQDSGAVYCWGRNTHGELGLPVPTMTPMGCTDACSAIAIAVQGLPAAPSPIGGMDAGVDAGMDGGMDASLDGHVDPHVDAGVDIAVVDAFTVRDAMSSAGMAPTAIAAGESFACALLADSTVRCWGDDSLTQLGDGRTTMDPQAPAMVIATPGAASNNPLQSVTSITSGAAATCGRINDGSLRCWGSNQDGALGTGSTSPQLGPAPLGW